MCNAEDDLREGITPVQTNNRSTIFTPVQSLQQKYNGSTIL